MREILLNAHYMVIFRNLSDLAQIQHLSRQVCPDEPRFLQQAYHDATSKPYGYLLLDLKQETPDNFCYRSFIFPDDEYAYVFVLKKNKTIKRSDASHFVPVESL